MSIKDSIINILRRQPRVRRVARICYWNFKKIQAAAGGARMQEKYWQKRHLSPASDWQGGDNWVQGYWNSKTHPHREFLVDMIASWSPASVLEIGANCGPNLYLLSKRIPAAKLIGIDINREAVKIGNELLRKNRAGNVDLRYGRADLQNQFEPKSFDVVFTDAVLIYVAPGEVKKVIKQVLSVARKAAVFLEWHQESPNDTQGRGIYHFGHWKRDYKKLLGQFVDEKNIKVTKLSAGVWPGKEWSSLGCVIEVKF